MSNTGIVGNTRAAANTRIAVALAFAAPLLAFLAVYVPAAGHGFVKDDSLWILQSRVRSLSDFFHLFQRDNGFYRPIVGVTFAIDDWLFGSQARGYGWTNVLLAMLCFGSLVRLARALGLPLGAAWLSASLWLLNPRFMRMGVLWISGRTSLLAALFATLAATDLVRGSVVRAAGWLAVACFAKEEALPVAVILAIWLVILPPPAPEKDARRRIVMWLAAAGAVLVVYLFARARTGAMTPLSAPDFYRYCLSPSCLAKNVAEYADRALTLPLVAVLAALVVLGWSRARPFAQAQSIVRCGLVWLVIGFAPTILLPVRSDLYACLPSVGACLAAGAIIAEAWRGSTDACRRRALAGALALSAALGVVHAVRVDRWVRPADLSSRILDELQSRTAALPDSGPVVITYDPADPLSNLDDAFGGHLKAAFEVRTGRRLDFSIEPAPGGLDRETRPCPSCAAIQLAVVNGELGAR